MNQKLVRMDIQRLSSLVFIICVSSLPETFILFMQKRHNSRFLSYFASRAVAGQSVKHRIPAPKKMYLHLLNTRDGFKTFNGVEDQDRPKRICAVPDAQDTDRPRQSGESVLSAALFSF
jgi:hypothetical protein